MHKKNDAKTMAVYEAVFGFCVLIATLLVELVGYILRFQVGIWFSGYFLPVYRWFPLAWTHHHPLGPAAIGNAFLLIGVVCHLKIIGEQFMQAQKERLALRLRKPSKQEQDQVEKAYTAMDKKAYARSVQQWKHPPRFRVYQGEGHQVRFIGQVLVVDVGLFQLGGSPYLVALLAQAMWDYNGPWRHLQGVLQVFPDASWVIVGFFGRWATWIVWQLYSRYHAYHADVYAAQLGQKQSLITTLEEILLPLDEPRAHFFYAEPYAELRIDHLHQLPF